MKYLPGSLEIKLSERLSKNDILDILAEQMTMLEETFGIEEFNLNCYLGCYIDNKKQSLYHEEHNNIVNSINLKNDTKLENTSKLISKNGNARVVSFDKNINVDKIRSTVESIQKYNPYRYWSNNIKVIPSSVVKSIIQDKENQLQIERDKLYLIRQLKREQEEAQRRKEREEYERPLKSLIARKIMESGLTDLEFKRIICSSYDYIKSRAVIAKYLANKPDLLETYHDSRLIRMSIKNDEGKVGKVEIYDLSGMLIFESYKNN
ncbi:MULTISPECIES: hypothetical protein [Klebsiella]|nr:MULTISPECIES: hypothetical protein [Klebsiella]EJX2758213.1 hypothetical protein [Salmonella enterica]HBW3123424.1 hypothetical protein [Klebsiella pneumoniae]EJX2849501.1 hypothetical protein [Salmonella enterica]UDC56637.1 hypothetical protein LGM24_09105 [Klebsiella quasipneumoniae subsp. quasipneumoniae]VGO92587.1 hypothetical protein SB02110_01236 [Klebsiella quasipneumoniae subsp. quasipneumoniae]